MSDDVEQAEKVLAELRSKREALVAHGHSQRELRQRAPAIRDLFVLRGRQRALEQRPANYHSRLTSKPQRPAISQRSALTISVYRH